jgi:hypothetical protein
MATNCSFIFDSSVPLRVGGFNRSFVWDVPLAAASASGMPARRPVDDG